MSYIFIETVNRNYAHHNRLTNCCVVLVADHELFRPVFSLLLLRQLFPPILFSFDLFSPEDEKNL